MEKFNAYLSVALLAMMSILAYKVGTLESQLAQTNGVVRDVVNFINKPPQVPPQVGK